MARRSGPDEAYRGVYTDAGVFSADGLTVRLYADEAKTTPADVLLESGDALTISGAARIVPVDPHSKIPRLQYPADGSRVIYCTVNDGDVTPLYSDIDEREDDLSASITLGDASTLAAAAADATAKMDRLGNGFVGLGDSISTVTGGAGYGNSWTIAAPMLSNQRLHYLGNGGVAGETSTQILARVPNVIALGPKVVTILAGTNDLTQLVAFATWSANIISMVTQLRAAQIVPVLCTIPPRGNTTFLATNCKWNNWLRNYARVNGLALLDFFSVLVDPATGMYASGYDSGDALHPSPAGHMAMANLVVSQLVPRLPPNGPPRAVSNTGDADNLVSNPLLATGSPTPTGFTVSGTGGLTGFTEQLVTDSDFLGKAWEWNFTNPSSGSGFRQITYTLSGGSWSIGDNLLFVAKLKVVSQSNVVFGNGIGLRFTASFFSAGTPTVTFVPGDTVVHAAGLHAFRTPVQTSTTIVAINAGVFSVPTNGQLTARVGEFAVFNLTALGLS